MKICVVGPTYPYRGGISHYTTLLVKHLRETGHWTRFYSFTRQYPRWLYPGKSDKDPSQAPLRVECEYVLDPINPLTWVRLYRRVRADAPDVLILQWWVPYWTPCMTMISRWIKQHTQIRIVFVCHNVMPHEGGGILDRRLATTVLRQGDVFIVHSEQDRYRLQALLPRAVVIKAQHPTYGELTHVSSAAQSILLRHELHLSEDAPVLLFFGLVRPYKGLEYLIQALPIVLTKMKVQLLVVGEFWSSPAYYERYARAFGVEHAIVFVDRYVPNEELAPYFALADVVVLPYISATGSGVVQLAFGFGKPVITTRVGGLHEAVEDGVNGLVVAPQDEEALARAILRFFDEELGPAMAQQVRDTAAAQPFSWQQLISSIEQAANGERED